MLPERAARVADAQLRGERVDLAASEKLGIDPSKVIINIERFGNTTAATIPTDDGARRQIELAPVDVHPVVVLFQPEHRLNDVEIEPRGEVDVDAEGLHEGVELNQPVGDDHRHEPHG